MTCELCGKDHDRREIIINDKGNEITISGPDCHCIYEDGLRIAIGICCGHMIGETTLRDEDESDLRRKNKNARR